MSIRYLNNADESITLQKIEDLFDPRLNNLYSPTTLNGIQPRKFVDLLNALYCSENLLDYDNFKHLVFSGEYPNFELHEDFLSLSANVPSDQHWLFYALRCQYTAGGRKRYSLPSFVNSSLHNATTVITTHLSKTIEQPTAEQFVTFVHEIHTKWHTDFLSNSMGVNPEHLWHFDCLAPVNNVSYQLTKYTRGSKYTEGGLSIPSLTAFRVFELLSTDPTYQIKTDLEGRGCNTKLSQRITQNNRRQLYSVMNYSADVLSILSYPNKEPKEKDPILVGVELEVATDYSMQDLVDAATEPFFIGKQDSSITGSKHNKVELVTAPSSFKYLKKAYAEWLNKLDYQKFDTTTTTNNGMHVHVGREHFEDNTHIRNFCWFFNNPANSDFLIYISERGSYEAMQRYSPFYQFPHGCSRTKAFRQVYQFLGQGFRGITNFKGGWAAAKTVEVRMFRGIVSYASIVKNLEFVDAIFHFTKGLVSYRQLTLSGFLSWLSETNPNKYILLKKFIDMADLSKMTAAADVKDILFNETDNEKIIQLLSHSALKITNEHISILNRGKKRTFQFDKATGAITVIHHNRSKLQPLDVSFAQRYLRMRTAS